MSLRSRLTGSAKRLARRTLDRALLPYVHETVRELAARQSVVTGAVEDSPPSANTVSDFFHNTMHELRTLELESAPKGARRALSVGASGRWYFDWFERHVGIVEEHIGVEAFEPCPPDLPGYATWIESTADRFAGVADGSVDLVFAGQTTEHLWADELAGFLLECHRVLRPGGALVADSPNRLITELLHWSHGGHTIELSVSEMAELMSLAGFDIIRRRGVWMTRFDGRVHELEDGLDSPATVVRRIALGGDDPDSSFIWWIDAERADREPDDDTLRKRVDALFADHWDTRVSRGMWPGPGSPGPLLDVGDMDRVVASLPLMLHEAGWRVSVRPDEGSLLDLQGLRLRVTSPGGYVVHDPGAPARLDDAEATWEFDQQSLQMALSIEIHIDAVLAPVRLAMPVSLTAIEGGRRAERG